MNLSFNMERIKENGWLIAKTREIRFHLQICKNHARLILGIKSYMKCHFVTFISVENNKSHPLLLVNGLISYSSSSATYILNLRFGFPSFENSEGQ